MAKITPTKMVRPKVWLLDDEMQHGFSLGNISNKNAYGSAKLSDRVRTTKCTLSDEALSLMPLLDVDIDMLNEKHVDIDKSNNNTQYEVGAIYSLGHDSIEGFSFKKTYYRLYGVINEFNGVNLDSLIVCEVTQNEDGTFVEDASSSNRRRFSIPPWMCKLFNVKYQPGLELWSMSNSFEKVNLIELDNTRKKIDYANLATYPTSNIDNTIRKMLIELHGFSNYGNDKIITPTGNMIDTNLLINTLCISSKKNIPTDNGCTGLIVGQQLPFKIVSRQNETNKSPISICDNNHNIHIEIDFKKKSLNAVTKDGFIGVSNTSLDGFNINDIINVTWEEPYREIMKDEEDRLIEALNRHFEKITIEKFVN